MSCYGLHVEILDDMEAYLALTLGASFILIENTRQQQSRNIKINTALGHGPQRENHRSILRDHQSLGLNEA
jgi:hypothetical protein